MLVNESLQNFDERMTILTKQGKRIPQVVFAKLPRLKLYANRELSELAQADCDKLSLAIDNALLVAENKKVASVIHISEHYMTEDALLKKAGIYAQKKAELAILEENYARRKNELISSMSDAESKIPLAQMGAFSELIKQIA